ncbi:MAG: MFS transporter, partial [Deltaproteobacteria bacterium]|nr:MFS transporter [Deltaproteobacteria bacterium]
MINKKIAVVLSLAFLTTFGYGLILPSLSLYAQSLGASRSYIGMIVSVYALAQLLTQIPAGRFADRLGRKTLLLVGFIGIAIAAFLNNIGTGPNEFFVFQALAGASTGCLWPSLMAVLSEESRPNTRGKLMGTFATIFFLGMGIGPYVGGLISTQYGYLAAFNLWSLSAVGGWIVSALTFQAA